MKFYIGLHQLKDARHFPAACISINRLLVRTRKPVACADVLIDSGAFTELARHGHYRQPVKAYADELRRLQAKGIVSISAAVAQDFMCEPAILAKTGLRLADHQALTIQRYDELVAEDLPFPIMPVLQGFAPADYARHALAYGARFSHGQWVGVGSVCKRQGDPRLIIAVLEAIAAVRPDLRLHGFGVKKTALAHAGVRELLYSADSMAWSFSARRQGRDGNDWQEAARFASSIETAAAIPARPWQRELQL